MKISILILKERKQMYPRKNSIDNQNLNFIEEHKEEKLTRNEITTNVSKIRTKRFKQSSNKKLKNLSNQQKQLKTKIVEDITPKRGRKRKVNPNEGPQELWMEQSLCSTDGRD
ncbi:hypothetical protein ILUMI_16872 [Ignelater luminosus]|uniref:Uncharacterized protein n=1 Tax=Ignelater luminosus TaxID=2038154 RepID=A0A8K0CQG2_IGNLU|nr:hypothetical protein ILUMI_16872 [Ignelater luminosus]